MTEKERPEEACAPDRICRIGSYNIHQCVGLDGRRDPARIASIIRSMKTDIVGLQEVNALYGNDTASMQLDYLADATGMRAIGGPTIQRHDGYYGNALLTRCRIMEVRRFDLTYRRRESRGVLDVELDIRGKLVRVLVTHLGLQPAERRFQVEKLLQILAEVPIRPVILLGDFNEWFLWGRPARWMHRYFGRSPAPKTFPAFLPVFSLDRILVRPQDALVETRIVRDRATRLASDHLPLLAQVKLF